MSSTASHSTLRIGRTSLAEEAEVKLRRYGQIRPVFTVTEELRVRLLDQGLGGMALEAKTCQPYEKDYDLIEMPVRWAQLWDLSTWVMLTADKGGRRLGGCVVAQGTCGIDLLEGRIDLAALWDMRVCPNHRREGIGSALFEAAASWARERGCGAMNIETQNNNIPACRLYARQGSELRSIKRGHYKNFPDEIQLVWHKAL